MAKTVTPQTKSADKNRDGSTIVKLGNTEFEVAPNSDVKVRAAVVEGEVPGCHTAQVTNRSVHISEDKTAAEVYRAHLEAYEGRPPFVVTTGVIYPQRPAPAPAAPAKGNKKTRPAKPAKKAKAKKAPKKDKNPSFLSQYIPEPVYPKIGEDTGNGWVRVGKQSALGRILNGVSAPVTVAKVIGEVDFAALERAARVEQPGKKIQNVHIPKEREVNEVFNAVAELVGKTGTSQAVWVNDATAVNLAAETKATSRKYGHKFTGVIFATLKQ